jgi:hypothetical protein
MSDRVLDTEEIDKMLGLDGPMNDYDTGLDIQRGKDVIDLVFSLTGGLGMICGGFARYVLSKRQHNDQHTPSDIDIFCGDYETYDKIISKFTENPKLRNTAESPIECKFKYVISEGFKDEKYSIQVIKPIQVGNMVADGDIYRVLDNFDFTIAKAAIFMDNRYETGIQTVAHKKFLQDDYDKYIRITNIHCPISSLKRAIKYVKYGYHLSSVESHKLFVDYENRTPDWKTLIADGIGSIDRGMQPSDDFISAMYLD